MFCKQGEAIERNVKFLSYLLLTALITACGGVTTVRPVEVGQNSLSLSVGGPVAEVPGMGTFPVPYSNLRYRWGIADRFEAHVGIHPTLLVFRALGLDAGVSYLILDQKELLPAICIGLNPTLLVNPFNREAFFYPEAEIAVSWLVHPGITVYIGSQVLGQMSEPHFPWALLAGSEIRIGSIGLTVEGKWYAPTEINDPRVVTYPWTIGNNGAVGVILGISLYPEGPDD